ncbi:DegT/DnrJ/EryC1/StrS family aminotransferase [Teredinibacter turnerae]|uniref:DegT/DnrJ/EryC1/StrS family aminotransferase n=1 Tax=Teredinibacter turnerae TaxID=2426 RepID=UPI00037CB235|nr:DegT/DnrJ/EryC1/StrS family aminotransferase [Teredinibacter turnerae]
MKKSIFVTQPNMPDLEEFVPYLQKIWDNKILTNNGPMHHELELRLKEYLGVPEISLFNNGTIALLTALQAERITGDVITTPFSFIATANSLVWNGVRPIFSDIDPSTFNLDPSKIEAAITPQTTAIMPVHCYGTPCDVEAIEKIADNYNLKVIYDAAHAFGVRNSKGSILNYGNLSVLSFHATKVFNTFEGGAIISPDAKTKKRIDNLKNFGILDETTVVAPGINGKMSEISAAFGLVQLNHIDGAIAKRREIDGLYRSGLQNIGGITLPKRTTDYALNYSYFPVLVEPDYPMDRDSLYEHLKSIGVYSRRYFYPLMSEFPMYRGIRSSDPSNLPVASAIASKILCLPIYPDLSLNDVGRIIDEIGLVT